MKDVQIANWTTAGYMSHLYPELRQLEVEPNIAELQAFGFTVLSPRQLRAGDLHERVLKAVASVSARRARVAPDFESGQSHRGMVHPLGQLMRFILWEDAVFEEVLLNPAMLGIVTYVLGPACILSQCNAILRGPGNNSIGLHTDEISRALPLHCEESMTVNATYLLTDYTKEGGALGVIPGSHRWRRDPTPSDSKAFASHMIPVEAPAGSMVIWGDHLWHGAFPRMIPGLRGTFLFNFARHHLQTQEPYRETCTQEALDRNPRRFAVLMDQFASYPYREEDEDVILPVERNTYLSLFDRRQSNGYVRLLSKRARRSIPASAQPTASPLGLAVRRRESADGAAPAEKAPLAALASAESQGARERP
ncbi:MAG: phytanoyl-CoA dioxygenase family protein [Steroidobacteraceae bacterium]